MYKLGYTVDVGPGFAPVDLNTAGATGLRACLKNAQSCIFLVNIAASGGTEDLVFTLKEHTASSSGTTTNFANVTTYWLKSATTLAGTESWVKQTQAASATITVAGATYGAKQVILAVQVNAKDLDDTYDYVSLSVADPGSTARLASGLVLLTDLTVRRDPANLQPTLF